MKRSLIVCLFVLHCCITSAQGEFFFNETFLHEIRIASLQPSDWDSIAARYGQELYTPMRIIIDGTTLDSVGVRIKGNNFLNNLDKGKFQAYKIDFNEFVKGQKYDGLKKINLNTREKLANHLAYRLCRENGVISPRTSFSKVYFDTVFVGNYLNLEQIDDTFLKQHYGNKDGNLYSASGKGAILEYLGPDKENYYYAYEKKSNEAANDYTDLQNLLFFISNSKDSDFADSVDRYIDFAPFLQSVVTEMTVCKRDAFYDAGRNFYLYYDSSRFRFVYIPDDFDYSFSDEFSFNLNFLNDQSPHLGDVSNVITDRFLKSDKLRDLYYGKVCHLIQKSFDPANLIGYIDWLSALANTWDFDFDDFSMRTTDEIRNFVIKRKTLLESDLQSGSFSCKANALDEVVTKPTLPAVYPIPVMENLTIRFKEVNTKFGIALSDLNGRICQMDDNLYGSRIVSFHAMPPGVYSLKISTGSGVQFVKITKL